LLVSYFGSPVNALFFLLIREEQFQKAKAGSLKMTIPIGLMEKAEPKNLIVKLSE
jgi:hypothetical protein